MEKLISRELEGETLCFRVRDQEWSQEAREELAREHGVLFFEDSVVPVLIRGKLLRLGTEDDGLLRFPPEAPRFHVRWAQGLARELEAAAAEAE